MRAAEGNRGCSLEYGIEDQKALAREKARLGVLRVGRVEYSAQWENKQATLPGREGEQAWREHVLPRGVG